MNREEYIAGIIGIAREFVGVSLPPECEVCFALMPWALLDDAIAAKVRAQNLYRTLQRVSEN